MSRATPNRRVGVPMRPPAFHVERFEAGHASTLNHHAGHAHVVRVFHVEPSTHLSKPTAPNTPTSPSLRRSTWNTP